MNKTKTECIRETPSDAVALFHAALPKEQKEERVFVLPLDAHGKALAKPILVSVGSEDGTAVIDSGAIFHFPRGVQGGGGGNHRRAQPSFRRSDAEQSRPRNDGEAQ